MRRLGMRRRRAVWALLGIAAVASGTAGCDPPIEFAYQELSFRLDREADTLEVELASHGIVSAQSGREDVQEAADLLEHALFDGCAWMLVDPFFHFDLEELWNDPDLCPETRVLLSLLEPLPSELYLDANARLCARQRLLIRPWSRFLQLFHDHIRRELIECDDPDVVESWLGVERLDDRSIELWREWILGDDPLIRLDERGLVLTVPASPEVQREILETALPSRYNPEFTRLLWPALREWRVEPTRMVLRLGDRVGDRVRLPFVWPGVEWDPALAEELEARGRVVRR